jgi:hypothetical protein
MTYDELMALYQSLGGGVMAQQYGGYENATGGASQPDEMMPVQMPDGRYLIPAGNGFQITDPTSSSEPGGVSTGVFVGQDGTSRPYSYTNPEAGFASKYGMYLPLAFAGGALALQGLAAAGAGSAAGGASSLSMGAAPAAFTAPTLGGGAALSGASTFGAGVSTGSALGTAGAAGAGALTLESVLAAAGPTAVASPGIRDAISRVVQSGVDLASSGGQQLLQALQNTITGGQTGGAGAMEAARMALLAQQWREANGQARDLEGQARTALDQQGAQIEANRGLVNSLLSSGQSQQAALAGTGAWQLAANTGLQAQLAPSAMNAVAQMDGFDPTQALGQRMATSDQRATDQYGRAISADLGMNEIARLNALAATREQERIAANNALQDNIGRAGTRMDATMAGLGDRRMFGEGDINALQRQIFDQKSQGVDRALTIASSQGFADALRNGTSNSTQAEMSRDEIVRRFSDVYAGLESSARQDALGQITALSGMEGQQRGAALSEQSAALSPELQARLQSYRPDDSALNAANTSATFNANNANQQRSFAATLAQLAGTDANIWSQGGNASAVQDTQRAQTLLSALAQQGQLVNQGISTQGQVAGNQLATGASLNRDLTSQENTRTTNFTNMAAAGRTAAGGAQNTLFNAAYSNFGRALSGGGSAAPTTPTPTIRTSTTIDRDDSYNRDNALLPGTI